jgi:hypothetical protein
VYAWFPQATQISIRSVLFTFGQGFAECASTALRLSAD